MDDGQPSRGGTPADSGRDDDARLRVTRRFVLGATATTAATLAVTSTAVARVLPQPRVKQLTLVLRRREDLLRVPVTLRNAHLDGGRYVPDGVNGYLIADLGPQHLAEQAFSGLGAVVPAVGARLSGSTRLAFIVEAQGVPATLGGLMGWSALRSSVSSVGSFTDGANIPGNKDNKAANPTGNQTAIEMPWWLVLTPHALSTWAHAATPVTRDGRTEVWHTRLAWHDLDADPPIGGAREDRDFWDFDIFTVRAVWLRDPQGPTMLTDFDSPIPAEGTDGHPWRMRPTPRQRANLVRLSTKSMSLAGSVTDGGMARAVPATIALSPLGGTMRIDAAWDSPDVAPILKWQQRTWQGRDTFVRVVEKGFLYPWGIPAALDEQVVRIWAAGSSAANGVRPYQQLKTKVVVTDPTMDLTTGTNPYAGRATPFKRITCLTRATPELSNANTLNPFVPAVQTNANGGSAPVMFDFVAVDQADREVRFSMPLMFVRYSDNPQTLAVRNAYAALPAAQRQANLGGAAVAFAAEGANAGSTSWPTGVMSFTLSAPLADADGLARDAFPAMVSAAVTLEDLSRLSGSAVTRIVEFPAAYLESAFDEASNQVQAYLKPTVAQAVALGAKEAGGMLAAGFTVAGLSRTLGPIPGDPADLATLCANAIAVRDPAAAAADLVSRMFGDIKLFAGLSLSDILGTDVNVNSQSLKITSKVAKIGKPDARATTTLTWTPDLSVVADTPADGVLDVSDAALVVTVTTTVAQADGASTWSSEGRLTGLVIQLVKGSPFITVELKRLTFTAGSGKDPNVDVEIGDVSFLGALSLLDKLAEYLPALPGGLSLDIKPTGLTAGYSLSLPNVALGAYTLTGIAVGVRINLPFDDRPVRTSFTYSGPDDPFGMTVLGLGGAGWFKSAMGLDGVEVIDIAGGLQACVALDFGVASGTVRIMAGFQFTMAFSGGVDTLTLTAFIRVMGRVDVLGLIEATIEVYIGLSVIVPELGSGQRVKLAGEAEISVKVKVLFVSKKVTWTIRREIEGAVVPDPPDFSSLPAAARRGRADSDPVGSGTWADAMSPANWNDWCGAFA